MLAAGGLRVGRSLRHPPDSIMVIPQEAKYDWHTRWCRRRQRGVAADSNLPGQNTAHVSLLETGEDELRSSRCCRAAAGAGGFSAATDCGILLLGSAVNQDGRSSSLTAPHGPSQQVRPPAAVHAATLERHEEAACLCYTTKPAHGGDVHVVACKANVSANQLLLPFPGGQRMMRRVAANTTSVIGFPKAFFASQAVTRTALKDVQLVTAAVTVLQMHG